MKEFWAFLKRLLGGLWKLLKAILKLAAKILRKLFSGLGKLLGRSSGKKETQES